MTLRVLWSTASGVLKNLAVKRLSESILAWGDLSEVLRHRATMQSREPCGQSEKYRVLRKRGVYNWNHEPNVIRTGTLKLLPKLLSESIGNSRPSSSI
ncbi:hypothetical protein Tco_0300090 [Tanacetum coccineum]